MDSNSLNKFLQGAADERETRQTEELLAQRETVGSVPLDTATDDSLIAALQVDLTTSPDNEAVVRQLTENLQRLVPRTEISVEEIRALLEPSNLPDSLGRIGRYEITQYLASGGMGLVFRATDPHLQRDVCLKLLHPARARSGEARTRFDRETRSIARLDCQRIMPILDLGAHRELPWLVMPLLPGGSLRSLMLQHGTLELTRALHITLQIAEGLNSAHEANILHRDIKPDNLWITPVDDVKLLDFGLARTPEESPPITHEGTVLGTPSYMSPEQITGKPVDGRSDLFSLGIVLVEMLTGESPFRRDNLFSTLMSVATDEVRLEKIDPQQKIPQPVRELITRLLSKDPAHRPSSAAAVAQSLRQLVNSSRQEGAEPYTSPKAMFGSRQRTWTTVLLTAVASLAMGLIALGVWNWTDKGTLVVETNDPQVEVKVVGERVMVRDPLTDRTHEIRIGATSLPSGVYQLEMADKSGDLVFSAQTIAIRRGERTVVTVQLKPPSESLAKQARQATDVNPTAVRPVDPAVSWIPPLEPVPRDQIADASYDPEVRDRFAGILKELPALPLAEHFPYDRISPAANVTNPRQLPGMDVWSLESPASGPNVFGWQANSDQTLFGIQDENVWVFDDKGQPRYMLPAPGRLLRFAFDTKHPQLIAVCSWTAPSTEMPQLLNLSNSGQTSDEHHYCIHVWRLGSDGAELIRSWKASSYPMAWDQGYRLIYVLHGNLVAGRVDTGESTVLTTMDQHATNPQLSPGGRFLTMEVYGESARTNLFDLHRGQFVSSIRGCGKVQWRIDEAAVAAFSDTNERVEIWRSDRPEMLAGLELFQINRDPSFVIKRARSSPALDNDFSHISWLSPDGKLIVRSLPSQREGSVSSGGLTQMSHARLSWDRDGILSVHGDRNSYQWKPTESEVHGTLTVIRHAAAPFLPAKGQISGKVAGFYSGRLFLQSPDESASLPAWERRDGNLPRLLTSSLAVSDLGTQVKPEDTLRSLGSEDLFSASPDGRWLARLNSGSQQLEVVDLNDGRKLPIIAASIPGNARTGPVDRMGQPSRGTLQSRFDISAIWSVDSRYLLLSGWNQPAQPPGGGGSQRTRFIKVWDSQAETDVALQQPFPELNMSSGQTLEAVAWQDGFLLMFQNTFDQFVERPLWLLRPATQQIVEIEMNTEQKDGWSLHQASGDSLFFHHKSVSEPSAWIRAKIVDGKIVETGRIECRVPDRLIPSPDGQHFCLIAYDPRSIKSFEAEGSDLTHSVEIANLETFPVTIKIAKWSEPMAKPLVAWKAHRIPDDPLWHPTGSHLAYKEIHSGRLFVLELSNLSWKSLDMQSFEDERKSLHVAGDCWFTTFPDKFRLLSPSGELAATWLFGTNPDKTESHVALAHGAWISPDGTIVGQSHTDGLQIVYRQGRRLVVESLQARKLDPTRPQIRESPSSHPLPKRTQKSPGTPQVDPTGATAVKD